MFENRTAAGKQLAKKLEQCWSRQRALYERSKLLVVGLPRGGVPVALEVAREFRCPLEVIVAKKLPCPDQPEYAIGAVSSDGIVILNPDLPEDPQWKSYIDEQRQKLLQLTMNLEKTFYVPANNEQSSFKDKVVIVVDDGVATGMTAIAALKTARKRGALRTVMAAPVMSSESYRELHSYCDEVVAISVPENFVAVGQHYLDFEPTSNEEVVAALRENALSTLRK